MRDWIGEVYCGDRTPMPQQAPPPTANQDPWGERSARVSRDDPVVVPGTRQMGIVLGHSSIAQPVKFGIHVNISMSRLLQFLFTVCYID